MAGTNDDNDTHRTGPHGLVDPRAALAAAVHERIYDACMDYDPYVDGPSFIDEAVDAVLADVDRHVEELRAESAELRRQLRFANERNHERNVQLDALHFVWCDGGCYRGVHRFGDCDRPLTEETVIAAERNTARLRRWWNAARHRVTHGVPGAHDKATVSAAACTGDPCTCTNGIGCVTVPVEDW